MKSPFVRVMFLALLAGTLENCNTEEPLNATSSNDEQSVALLDVAQTSGQLASGTSFRIAGSSTDSLGNRAPHGSGHHKKHRGILDGISLLAPTDELLAIVDAESASDFRGMRISKNGGATITHYNEAGEAVELPIHSSDGPHGCSFSGNQFPYLDSLLSTIVKTEIDFGSGVTYSKDTISITRAGKIIVTRTGDSTNKTEVTSFDNYTVNGIKIEGTKTRVTSFDATTGTGTSTTSVSNGKITFTDGTVASWISEKTRTSNITLDSTTNHPVDGTVVTEVSASVTTQDGAIIFSHKTLTPLTEDLSCGRRHGPVSGTLETLYHDDTVVVDYGDGSCENNSITITINGVTSTQNIQG